MMALFPSLLTTMVIVGAVWGAVLMQPVMAESSPDNLVSISADKAPTKLQIPEQTQNKSKTYIRSVVSQSIALDSVESLWIEFEDKLTQQKDLPDTLQRLVVIYQDIDKDFSHATVTIGFPVEASAKKEGYIELISNAQGQPLLNRGKNSKTEIANAWEEINFRRPVNVVIETHYLNALGKEDSNQLVVHYK
ncbi:TPA: hypothetical protein P0E36_000246 [Vibrio harveyi]|nr:hypothetical protein [Vibrio harveyi]